MDTISLLTRLKTRPLYYSLQLAIASLINNQGPISWSMGQEQADLGINQNHEILFCKRLEINEL